MSEREFGKPRITKGWLNLDEMWDYRTREYDFDYPIGLPKCAHVKDLRRLWLLCRFSGTRAATRLVTTLLAG